MKNFLARRFSNSPIRLDFKASTSVAGTLWIYQHYQRRKCESEHHVTKNNTNVIFNSSITLNEYQIHTFPLLYTKLPSTALKFRYFVTLVRIKTRTNAPLAIMNCKLAFYGELHNSRSTGKTKELSLQAPTDLGHHVDIVILADTQMVRSGVAAFESLPDLSSGRNET